MTDLKNSILDAALPLVIFDGWTQGTLEQAAQSIGHSGFDARRAFPGGAVEAVNYFFARMDAQMIAELRRDHDFAARKIRARIKLAIMVRLRLLAPHREAVRRALGFYALPWNLAAGTRALYRTVDAIWREAGDTSTDYNFYTKRLLLAKVLGTTMAVWLEDRSEDLREAEAFLDRRIDNVMQIEKWKSKAREKFAGLERWLPKHRSA